MTDYFKSQVGKMVPSHDHVYEKTAVLRAPLLRSGVMKAPKTVMACKVCGEEKK